MVKKSQYTMLASRILKEAEALYTKAEKNRLALIYLYAAKKLRHYMLAHKIKLVVGANPIRYLLSRPALSGRTARWLLQLSRILHRMFHSFFCDKGCDKGATFCRSTGPSKDPIELSEEIPGDLEQIATLEDGQWTLYFDESSTAKEEGGVGIVFEIIKRRVHIFIVLIFVSML